MGLFIVDFNLLEHSMKKNIIIAMLLAGMVSTSFIYFRKSANDAVLASKTVTQVAVIVKDIDKARNIWADVLGVDVPEVSIAESHPSRPTLYKGNPSDAKAKLAFLTMDNLQIELIEPMGGNSTWQEYLDEYGEGIHHIAFEVKDIGGVEKKFEVRGMPTVQLGGWDGGAYSYIDASDQLGCILELLENFR
jgi:methylmalonyl-CoA epimerase